MVDESTIDTNLLYATVDDQVITALKFVERLEKVYFLIRIIGERKIPAPTPIIPLKNPIPAPVDIEIFKLGIEFSISNSFFVWYNLYAAQTNVIESKES